MAKKGQSCSEGNREGVRRKALYKGNLRTLAPRFYRKRGKHFMDDVTNEEIAKTYLGFPGLDKEELAWKRSISSYKGEITKIFKKEGIEISPTPSGSQYTTEQWETLSNEGKKLVGEKNTHIGEIESKRNAIHSRILAFRNS